MTEYFKQLLADQFEASLAMLESCIATCPAEHWEEQIGNAPFWQVAYHTLFFVDFYLSADEQAFVPQPYHRQDIHNMDKDISLQEPYTRETLVEYIQHCRTKMNEAISIETQPSLEARSGFPWYPMSRGEHHLTSIRHIQHHAGQLSAYLRKHAGLSVDWIGKA